MPYQIPAREEALPSDYSSTCVCLAATCCCCWSKRSAAQLHGLLSFQHGCPPCPRPCIATECPSSQNGWVRKNSHQSRWVQETALPSMSLSRHLGHHFSHGVYWECPCHSSLSLGLSQALTKLSYFPSWGRSPVSSPVASSACQGLGELCWTHRSLFYSFLSSFASTFLILNKRAPGKLPRWFFMELREQGLRGDFLLHTLKSMKQI